MDAKNLFYEKRPWLFHHIFLTLFSFLSFCSSCSLWRLSGGRRHSKNNKFSKNERKKGNKKKKKKKKKKEKNNVTSCWCASPPCPHTNFCFQPDHCPGYITGSTTFDAIPRSSLPSLLSSSLNLCLFEEMINKTHLEASTSRRPYRCSLLQEIFFSK